MSHDEVVYALFACAAVPLCNLWGADYSVPNAFPPSVEPCSIGLLVWPCAAEEEPRRALMQDCGSTCEPPPSRITPGSSISQHDLPLRQCSAPEGGPSEHPDATITRAERAPHTWTQCPGAAFHVRQGPNYAVTGKKVRSSVEKASRAVTGRPARPERL